LPLRLHDYTKAQIISQGLLKGNIRVICDLRVYPI